MELVPPITEYSKKEDAILTKIFRIVISIQTMKLLQFYKDIHQSSRKKSVNY